MDWTKGSITELIKVYKHHENLYNPKHKLYYNKRKLFFLLLSSDSYINSNSINIIFILTEARNNALNAILNSVRVRSVAENLNNQFNCFLSF